MTTLVMIPAFGCDAALYAPVAARLRDHVTLQTVVSVEDRFSKMVGEVLSQAPDRFVVMGTSMGGRLALEVTLAAPDRVAGLVIIGAGAGGVADPAAGLKRSARIRAGEINAVLSEMGNMISHLPGPNGPAARDAFIAMGQKLGADKLARQSDALAHRQDRWSELSGIACPVLCLWGPFDQFSPPADGLRISASVQQGRYVEIADCGHFPSLEYPEETASILEHWLKDNHFT